MDPDKLLLLYDVVDCGGFSHAGRRRGLSHSTVSKHIKALEQQLGVTLLNRTSRTMSLTDEGRVVYETALRVHEHFDVLDERLEQMRGQVRGQLRVNALVHVGRHLVQPAIRSYLEEFPNMRVDARFDDGPLHFTRDGFDLAVRVGRHVEPHLVAQKLRDNQVCIVASPDFVDEHGAPEHPEALAHLPTVAYATADVLITAWPFVLEGEFRTVEVNPVCTVNEGNALLDAVRRGVGIGYLSAFAAQEDLHSGRLVQLLPGFELPPYDPIFMVHARAHGQSPRIRSFKRHLRAAARAL